MLTPFIHNIFIYIKILIVFQLFSIFKYKVRCVLDIASNNTPLLQNESGYINPIKLAISFLDIGRGKIR